MSHSVRCDGDEDTPYKVKMFGSSLQTSFEFQIIKLEGCTPWLRCSLTFNADYSLRIGVLLSVTTLDFYPYLSIYLAG